MKFAPPLASLFALFVSLSLGADVVTRTLNDGNLILEDIPEIPESVVDGLNRYQNTRSASIIDWSASGESLFITTRFGDLSQIHRVNEPGGARHQLTFFQESFRGVAHHPKRDAFLVGMDVGGSEFYQIYQLDTNTGVFDLLTDGKSRNSSFSWNRDGSAFSFTSTRRNGRSNDVWMAKAGNPQSAKLIVEAPDGSSWGGSDWNKTGDKLLVSQYVGNQDARIHLLDLNSEELALLEGGDSSPSLNFTAGFNRHETGYFLITNQKSEFAQLAFSRFEGGELEILTEKIDWEVDGFEFSGDRRRAAFTVNEGGMSALYLLDPDSFKTRKVDGLPVGLIGGLRFSPDGRRLAIVQVNGRSSSDVHVLELGKSALQSGKIEQWTFSETGGLDSRQFALPELIEFESFDGRKIPAFVSKPQGDGPFPVIIDIHGGPESQRRPGFSSTRQMYIDKLGAAYIEPNVRGSAGYGISYKNLDNGFNREDSVKDIGALLDWIATQKDLDASRVAVTGGSYGGYMVLSSAVHYSDRLVAAVDVVGISNFVTFLENTQDYRRDLRRAEYGDERKPEMRAFLQKISPNNRIDEIDIPMLIVQGQNDPRVPASESEQMVKALRDNGKPVWYLLAKNEGHGFRRKENRDVYGQVKFMFLKQYLGK